MAWGLNDPHHLNGKMECLHDNSILSLITLCHSHLVCSLLILLSKQLCHPRLVMNGLHKNTEALHSLRLLRNSLCNYSLSIEEEELSIPESCRLNTSGPHPYGRNLSHNPSGATRCRDAGPRLTGPGHKRLGLGPGLGACSSQRPAPAYPSSMSSYCLSIRHLLQPSAKTYTSRNLKILLQNLETGLSYPTDERLSSW